MENMSNGYEDEQIFRKAYDDHGVFKTLNYLVDFYESLSDYALEDSVTANVGNMDFNLFEDMKGSLGSLTDLLEKGRVLDAFAILLRLMDNSLYHIYTVLYCHDLRRYGVSPREQAMDWLIAEDLLPDMEEVIAYISEYEDVYEITGKFHGRFDLRVVRHNISSFNQRYTLIHNFLNHELVRSEVHLLQLQTIDDTLSHVVTHHMAYLFYTNEDYMRRNYLEEFLAEGVVPSEESIYEVAQFIQNFCNRFMKPLYPELYEEIKRKTRMRLA